MIGDEAGGKAGKTTATDADEPRGSVQLGVTGEGAAWRRRIFLLVTGVSAACGLVLEIVAGRMLAPYLGMSLYTWTAIIAVVLAGFTAGHWIGGRLAERPSRKAHVGVVAALVAAGLATLACLILLRVLSGPIIALDWSPVPTILLLTTLLFFLPSLFVGIPSPVLTKLAIDDAPGRMGATLGDFFAVGALGSIAGTLAAGFVFISWFGSVWTCLLVAGCYFALAALLAVARPPEPGGGASGGGAAADALKVHASSVDEGSDRAPLKGDAGAGVGSGLSARLVLTVGAGASVALMLAGAGVAAFQSPCDVESSYYCIRAVPPAIQAAPARTLVLDHLAHSTNVANDPRRLVTPYVELQDALARTHTGRRSPFRAFFVGGGAYTLPRAWLAARPDTEVVVAEIDPAVTDIARKAFWFPPEIARVATISDSRVDVRHEDARIALQRQPSARFDVVIGDAFHDIAVPPHLVTREFFALVADRLTADGIYVMNVVDSAKTPSLVGAVRASLQGLFPQVETWRVQTGGARSTYVVAGLREPTPFAQFASAFSSGVTFQRVTDTDMVRALAGQPHLILTDDYAPVDRLIGVE